MLKKTTAMFLLLLLAFVTLSDAEEVKKYEIGMKLVKGQAMNYKVTETSQLLIKNPTTDEKAIISFTTDKNSARIILSQEGIWLKTLEGISFENLHLDEATSEGAPLPAEDVNREKLKEIKKQRLENEIFTFSTMSEFGQPEANFNETDLSSILNFVSQNIAFIPPANREDGEEWYRKFRVGHYDITIDYELASVQTKEGIQTGRVEGRVSFGQLDKTDKLNIVRELSFALEFDIANSSLTYSELTFVAGVIKDNSIVETTLKIKRTLTSLVQLSDEQQALATAEAAKIKELLEHITAKKYDESYAITSAILKNPNSVFSQQIKVFMRDRIFLNWNVQGRKVEHLWFSEWINSEPLDMETIGQNVTVIAFFDPEISSSTRIWRPFDDWKEHFCPKGLTLIAASAAKPEKVKAYVKEMDLKHTIACDEEFLMLNYFQVDVVPSFFVIDKTGTIVLKIVGKREIYKVHKKLEEYFGVIEE